MAKWQAARVDVNQPELVEYLRKLGASFQHTHTVPGALDGIVGFRDIDQRVEIKDPNQTKRNKELTQKEITTFATWKGRPPIIIFTKKDCKELLKKLHFERMAINKLEL